MASLTEVYDGHLRTVTTSRRVTVGAGLFALGAAMVVGSIVVATTTLGAQFGLDRIAARRLAGVLAGLGLPATVLGVFAVLPAGRTTRAASVIGASVTVFGVALFWVAYPDQWFGTGDALAAATAVVYVAGVMTTLSCLFAGLATFKTRNDPGGTARMEITEEGGVRLVEDADPVPGFGSVGFFGRVHDCLDGVERRLLDDDFARVSPGGEQFEHALARDGTRFGAGHHERVAGEVEVRHGRRRLLEDAVSHHDVAWEPNPRRLVEHRPRTLRSHLMLVGGGLDCDAPSLMRGAASTISRWLAPGVHSDRTRAVTS
jgi:cytochrome c biogenesis protein CcdA